MGALPQVFISYSHDSQAHRDGIYRLAARLRSDGVDVELDQYHESAPPDEGWAAWSEQCIETADFVLVICTQTYLERYQRRLPPGTGRGVAWEGMVITQILYDQHGRNQRFIPLVMAAAGREYIPLILKGTNYYDLSATDGYEKLYRHLTGQPARVKPPIGPVQHLPPDSPAQTSAGATTGAVPTVHNLPLRNPHFIGREEILAQLQAQLQTGGRAALTQAITGLGGIGKTQIALEYCYQQAASYRLIWWLHAQEPTTLATGYAALAKALNLPEAHDPDQQQQIAAVRRYLEQQQEWLLIFDNAEAEEVIEAFLPRSSTGHVLITSRLATWEQITAPIAVQTWPRETSCRYIQKRLPATTSQEAEALATLMGDLPLALAQATAYMAQTKLKPADYAMYFRDHQKAMLAKGNPPAGYEKTVATTWEITLAKLAQESPEGVKLLTLAAYLAPDQIPAELLQAYITQTEAPLAEGPDLRLGEALAALERYSLITRTEEEISLHRLLQAVVRHRLTKEEQATQAENGVKILLAYAPKNLEDPATWPTWAKLLPHALAATEQAEEQSPGPVAILLHWAGTYLIGIGQYITAHTHLTTARSAGQAAAIGPEDEAAILTMLCEACRFGGDFPVAYQHAQAALQIYEQAEPPDDLQIARARVELAESAVGCGRWEEARQQAEAAKERLRQLTPAEEEQDTEALNNLASVYCSLGEAAGALEFSQRSLEIRERRYGQADMRTIITRSNVGVVLKMVGRFDEARTIAEQSLQTVQAMLPQGHPNLAHFHHSLADLLYNTGDQAGAKHHWEQAVAIGRQGLGPNHPRLAGYLSNLGAVLTRMGDLSGARPHQEEALKIMEQAYGQAHPSVATMLENLGTRFFKEGDLPQARAYFERALAIYQQFYNEEHPMVQRVQARLALLAEKEKA